jgi:hypothetical protein
MNKATRTDRVEQFSKAERPMVQVGMATVDQFWDRGQSITTMLTNWNTEFAHFMGHRINQTNECIGQMAQCRSLPELLEVQGQWFKRAYDDYSEVARKMMEANGKLLGCLTGSTEQLQQHSAVATPSPAVAS